MDSLKPRRYIPLGALRALTPTHPAIRAVPCIQTYVQLEIFPVALSHKWPVANTLLHGNLPHGKLPLPLGPP